MIDNGRSLLIEWPVSIYNQSNHTMAKIQNEKNYWCYTGSCYLLEFVLPGWMINEIAHPGPNDADVERNAKTEIVQKAFSDFSDDQIRQTYNEACYEDNNPNADRQEMIEYLLWDAVWNIVDEQEENIQEGELHE